MRVDFLSWDFYAALGIIILIDLVLAGDNAIVIGMSARNVPKEHQKKVILWGTAGAITIRIIATMVVVVLLDLPWLHLIGGLLLVWIAVKLLIEEKEHEISAKDSILAAIRTIIIADAAMGIDNVIAVAGAAQGEQILVIIGLLISVPIMVWGSTMLIRLINRYPWIIYLGAGILAWTAAKMITGEHVLADFFKEYVFIKWAIIVIVIVGVIISGKLINRSKQLKKIRHATDLSA